MTKGTAPEDSMKQQVDPFGSRMEMLGRMILQLSMSGQPCDVTFHDRAPAIDVTIDQKISLALMYGAGAGKLQELLENISLSSGDVVSIGEIWTINPMPKGGFSQQELDAVNLADGDQPAGPNGETIRDMIRAVYHCTTKQEEDDHLRRYLAS